MFIALLSVLAAVAYCNPYLVLYKAGMTNPRQIRRLQKYDQICPQDFSSGFSIRCVTSFRDMRASFYVNNRLVNFEFFPPYYIAGDNRHRPFPWKTYPKNGSRFKLSCRTRSGTATASLKIGCNSGKDPSQAPKCNYKMKNYFDPVGSLYFREANARMTKHVLLQNGMIFCPSDVYRSNDISVLCKGPPGARSARFKINGRTVRYEPLPPYYIGGDKAGVPRPWKYSRQQPMTIQCVFENGVRTTAVRNVKIGCPSKCSNNENNNNQSPSTSSPPTRPPSPFPIAIPADSCISIDARDTSLSFDWEIQPNGVGYRLDKSTMNTTAAGETPLYYLFKVPRKSHYAIVLDMTTGNQFYFNDVWLKLHGGMNLRYENSVSETNDWEKVFHNENGRAISTWAQDEYFQRRSLSSARELSPGITYLIGISGRSNQVLLHRILLFPCDGIQCQHKYWKSAQNACAPNSYVF